jgi:hypothetical protein
LTAYTPIATAPVASKPKLALVTLIVLTAHALLLLGLPHWAHTVSTAGGLPVFQTRTIMLAPLQPAVPVAVLAETAPQPQPPKPKPKPRPKPPPIPIHDTPAPTLPDSRPRVDRPPRDTTHRDDSLPLSAIPLSAAQTSAVAAPVKAADTPLSLLQGPPLATFGGKMPPPPIVPPLPPDQVLAVMRQAAQPSSAGSAAQAAGTTGTSHALPPVQLPRPVEIVYNASVTQGGRTATLRSTLDWQHDGQFYGLRWMLYGPAIGDRSRYATGLVTVRGLVPIAARAIGPNAYDLTFDYAPSRLRDEPLPTASTSGGTLPNPVASDTPLSPQPAASATGNPMNISVPLGTQDPLSVLIELGALIAGNPSQYPVGSHISLPMTRGNSPTPQSTDFTIVDDGDFSAAGQFQGQHLSALHLAHEPNNDHDARIELWLGKLLDYLPLRLLVIQPEGQQLDMTLQSAYTQTVPPPAPASSQVGEIGNASAR